MASSWFFFSVMFCNVSLCCKSSRFTNSPSKTMTLNWQWKDVVPLMFRGLLPQSSRKLEIFLGITSIYKYDTWYNFMTKQTNYGKKEVKPAVYLNVKYRKQKKNFYYFRISLSFVTEIWTDRLKFTDVAIFCTCGSNVS